MQSNAIMAKEVIYTSYVLVILTSTFCLLKYLDYHEDICSLQMIGYLITLTYGILMLYKEYYKGKCWRLACTLRTSVQTLTVQFYSTSLLSHYGITHAIIYVPSYIGNALMLFYLFRNKKKTIINNSVYLTSCLLQLFGCLCGNYSVMTAGIILGVGQYILTSSKTRYNLLPYQQFNYFLAAFTLCSYISLMPYQNEYNNEKVID